jgi:hypothetical protein
MKTPPWLEAQGGVKLDVHPGAFVNKLTGILF